jgi:hypothetical protein
MARGLALTTHQVQAAITHNRSHHAQHATTLATLRATLGLGPNAPLNEAFVRAVADWQEDHIRAGAGDGKVSAKTEAYLNIRHPKATVAAAHAVHIQAEGMILFDSWRNDVRDNNNDGTVDDPNEKAEDGAHYAGTYPSFSVIAGTYTGLGWGRDKTLTVPRSVTVLGPFMYRVCAAVVSRAYHEAGVMPEVNRVATILERFRAKGYVWKWSEGHPSEYLPGDLICTLDGGVGHAGIVVTRAPTTSRPVPTVVELPGPSTQVDLGTYNPASTNDVRLGTWTKAGVRNDNQYLGRLLLSKLR